MSVSIAVLLPEATNMPIVMTDAMLIVLVATVVHLEPLLDCCITILLPVRVIRSQQLGGVNPDAVVLEGELPASVRRRATMFLDDEPRRTMAPNFAFAAVLSRIITPANAPDAVLLWLDTRAVIDPSPLSVWYR